MDKPEEKNSLSRSASPLIMPRIACSPVRDEGVSAASSVPSSACPSGSESAADGAGVTPRAVRKRGVKV